MYKKEVDAFEAKAKELISDALKLARENDAATELPQPSKSIHRLSQFATMSFISATKMLIIVLHHEIKGSSPYDAELGEAGRHHL